MFLIDWLVHNDKLLRKTHQKYAAYLCRKTFKQFNILIFYFSVTNFRLKRLTFAIKKVLNNGNCIKK